MGEWYGIWRILWKQESCKKIEEFEGNRRIVSKQEIVWEQEIVWKQENCKEYLGTQ